MNLWRLEWLRMTRTRRWVVVLGVFAFFGILGPFSARYIGEILERFGGGVEVAFPEPIPADGIAQYVGNAQQLGLLVLIMIAAGALTMESRYEMAVFLRTRVKDPVRLVLPRYVVVAGTGIVAFFVGILLAWYETSVLIGTPEAGPMIIGSALFAVYLMFAVAVVALAGVRLKNVVPTVITALAVLLVLPLIGLVPSVADWLPSHLVGALDGLLRGDQVSDYLKALAVTLALVIGFLYSTVRSMERREL